MILNSIHHHYLVSNRHFKSTWTKLNSRFSPIHPVKKKSVPSLLFPIPQCMGMAFLQLLRTKELGQSLLFLSHPTSNPVITPVSLTFKSIIFPLLITSNRHLISPSHLPGVLQQHPTYSLFYPFFPTVSSFHGCQSALAHA